MSHLFLFSSLILFSLFFLYPSFVPLVNAQEGDDVPTPSAEEASGDVDLLSGWRPPRTSTRRYWTSSTRYHAVGDPSFLGFHSQPFQVHGQDNAIYNLISSALLQVNTQFHFIKEGESRNIQELRQKLIHQNKVTSAESKQHNHNHTNPLPPLTLAFSHPGQYMIGFAFKIRPFSCLSNRSTTDCDDSNITYLEIASGAYEDGLQLLIEQRLISPSSPQIIRYPSNCKDYEFDNTDKDDQQCDLIIDYSSPYRVSLHFRWFSFIIENSDCFLNIPSISLNENMIKKDIEIIRNSKIGQRYLADNKKNSDGINYLPFLHGLLGCSYTVIPSEKLPYGAVDDYLEEEKNIFGNKFISNRF